MNARTTLPGDLRHKFGNLAGSMGPENFVASIPANVREYPTILGHLTDIINPRKRIALCCASGSLELYSALPAPTPPCTRLRSKSASGKIGDFIPFILVLNRTL